MLVVTVAVAVIVPLLFLYALHWLDLYGTDRPRIVLMCLAWGIVAFAISFAVNRFLLDVVGVTRPFLSTRIAPFVEEVAKAGILVWLARRSWLYTPVDGAIYGFACGVGFAAVENLRYMQLFPDNALALMVLRDFSSALTHGTASAFAGLAVGGLSLAQRQVRRVALIGGLAGAMLLHYLWNNFSYFSPFARNVTEWVLVAMALGGLGGIAAAILWCLGRERAHLETTLGAKLGVPAEETKVLQHLDDLDHLLAPIALRFGRATAVRVGKFLHLEARLELAEDCRERAGDPELAAVLAREVLELTQSIGRERRALGMYVMLHVRSILPDTAWSMWTRLSLACGRAHADPAGTLWTKVGNRCGACGAGDARAPGRDGMHVWRSIGDRCERSAA